MWAAKSALPAATLNGSGMGPGVACLLTYTNIGCCIETLGTQFRVHISKIEYSLLFSLQICVNVTK